MFAPRHQNRDEGEHSGNPSDAQADVKAGKRGAGIKRLMPAFNVCRYDDRALLRECFIRISFVLLTGQDQHRQGGPFFISHNFLRTNSPYNSSRRCMAPGCFAEACPHAPPVARGHIGSGIRRAGNLPTHASASRSMAPGCFAEACPHAPPVARGHIGSGIRRAGSLPTHASASRSMAPGEPETCQRMLLRAEAWHLASRKPANACFCEQKHGTRVFRRSMPSPAAGNTRHPIPGTRYEKLPLTFGGL